MASTRQTKLEIGRKRREKAMLLLNLYFSEFGNGWKFVATPSKGQQTWVKNRRQFGEINDTEEGRESGKSGLLWNIDLFKDNHTTVSTWVEVHPKNVRPSTIQLKVPTPKPDYYPTDTIIRSYCQDKICLVVVFTEDFSSIKELGCFGLNEVSMVDFTVPGDERDRTKVVITNLNKYVPYHPFFHSYGRKHKLQRFGMIELVSTYLPKHITEIKRGQNENTGKC